MTQFIHSFYSVLSSILFFFLLMCKLISKKGKLIIHNNKVELRSKFKLIKFANHIRVDMKKANCEGEAETARMKEKKRKNPKNELKISNDTLTHII